MKSKSHIYQRIVFLLLATLMSWSSYGQAEFESNVASGNWNVAGSWTLVSGIDGDGNGIPDANDDVTILSGHNITMSGNQSANTLTINNGGTLTNTGGDLTITTFSMSVDGGGTYIHARDDGTIPDATWAATSNCTVTGTTGNLPAGMSQNFGNLTFNCTGIGGNLSLNQDLTTQNNLTVLSTGGGRIYVSGDDGTPKTITVGGDFIMSGGQFRLSQSTGGGAMTVANDFIQSGGEYRVGNGPGSASLDVTGDLNISGAAIFTILSGNAISTATVGGNVSVSGGQIRMSENAGFEGTLTVNGNLSHTAGTIWNNGTAGTGINYI